REACASNGVPRSDRGARATLLVNGRAVGEHQPNRLTRIEADRRSSVGRCVGRGSATSCCNRKDERDDDADEAQTSGHAIFQL
ncbi:MAG TPA: hypothetical protein VH560_04620, partial [Polyangia bacterium]|nr:hypothetical protein [Polyangia bacterium]